MTLVCDKSVTSQNFALFELLVWKETFADALLTGITSQRNVQNSPLESSCVVPLIEYYNISKLLKVSPEKSQILSCDTVVVVTLLSHVSDVCNCQREQSGINKSFKNHTKKCDINK
jgi:hypothetical protein